MLLIVDYLLNRRKEDVVVKAYQVYLIALLIVEWVSVAVEAKDELGVVAEDFLESKARARAIDAEDACDWANYDLVYPVILQQERSFFEDELYQIDDSHHLSLLNLHFFA